MTRVVAVQHTEAEHPGHVSGWLAEAGIDLETGHPYAGAALPALGECDGLIVLGGPMGAGDDDVAPWLPGVRALLADAVSAGIPTLGICLGAQLLAVACGGRVVRGEPGPEIGVCPLQLAPDATRDALLRDLPDRVQAGQWHYDAITELPPGAVLLASSAHYPHQAFRLGETAWGLQFHPELTADLAEQWAAADADELRRLGRDPEEVAATVREQQEQLVACWQPVIARWAAVVADSAALRRNAT